MCDGHGGATASSFAARHLYKNITSSPEYPKHIQNAIMAGFAKTEDDLATHVKNLPGFFFYVNALNFKRQ